MTDATKTKPTNERRKNGKRKGGKPKENAKAPKKEPAVLSVKEQILDRGRNDIEGVMTAWTIAKQTTFDVKTFKETKRVYLVRCGEGDDVTVNEVATLAEARKAVGRVIIHPEPAAKPAAPSPKSKK